MAWEKSHGILLAWVKILSTQDVDEWLAMAMLAQLLTCPQPLGARHFVPQVRLCFFISRFSLFDERTSILDVVILDLICAMRVYISWGHLQDPIGIELIVRFFYLFTADFGPC